MLQTARRLVAFLPLFASLRRREIRLSGGRSCAFNEQQRHLEVCGKDRQRAANHFMLDRGRLLHGWLWRRAPSTRTGRDRECFDTFSGRADWLAAQARNATPRCSVRKWWRSGWTRAASFAPWPDRSRVAGQATGAQRPLLSP
jgi:hypothetical protein